MAVINKYALEGRDDYIGFTYNGHHSSEYRVVRVNTGSRYETSLVPTPKDTTIDAVGRDGLYYVTSKYQQLTFSLNIAFDDLYDEDIRNLKEWLSPKSEGELWFDEDPYKQYSAKITSNPKLSWIAFDEPTKGRVYKGEGTIQFICYYPWASSRFRNLSEVYKDVYGVEDPSTLNPVVLLPRGWEAASGLEAKKVLETAGTGIVFDRATNSGNFASSASVYNAGNIAAPWQLAFSLANKGVQKIEYFKGEGTSSSDSLGRLYIDTEPLYNSTEQAFLLDAKLHLLLGIEMPGSPGTYIQTGNVYNYAIVGGDFFNIEPGQGTFKFNPSGGTNIIFQPDMPGNIVYDYLYY